MGAGVPEVILTEVILTVSECVRDHQESQNDLSGEFKTRDSSIPKVDINKTWTTV